jgi:hypothetical protein
VSDTSTPDPTGQLRPGEATASPARIGGDRCPSCDAARDPQDEFCEVCGLDFATGRLPDRPPPPSPAGADVGASGWVVVIEADRAMFDSLQAENPDAAVAFPGEEAPRSVVLEGDVVLIGRRSDHGGVFPEIDLGSPPHHDPGVSRRHATLHRAPDGTWSVRDEGSTNGTRVNAGEVPLRPGELVPLADGDRVHVGAFTRLTMRRGK